VSPQAVIVAVTAPSEVRDARRIVKTSLGGVRSVVLTAFNFTDYDLVLDDCAPDRDAFDRPPATTWPARTAMIFSARGTGAHTGGTGRLVWRGAHPDQGDFLFEIAWATPLSGANHASARAFHRVPWPSYAEYVTGCGADGVPIETSFLGASAVASSGRPHAGLYFALHPESATACDDPDRRGASRRSPGAKTHGIR
jgi:hypothetical protein